MRYSLNITAINQIDMETIQARATTAILAAQGYNRHMPREVVYAPTRYQGIGMQHLYNLQGSDGTRLFDSGYLSCQMTICRRQQVTNIFVHFRASIDGF
jgi:hypothetical protein